MFSDARHRREQELDAEIQYHLDMLTEQNVTRGMSRDAARREAQRLFGTVAGVKDDVRDRWPSRVWETLAQDARYGLRSLRRSPGFALVIILTMALGIGANTAIFSVVNGVLLRPLPYANGDEIVVLHQGEGDVTAAGDIGFSPKDIADYRQSRSLLDVVEFHSMFFNLLGRSTPERVNTGVVSGNYFDVLGVRPLIGRTFVASDDTPGAPAVLVLSHKYWQRSFGADPRIIGQVFRMNDKPHTVIGVLPEVPQYPQEVDVYMPASACPFRSAPALVANRQGRMLLAFARIKPDVTLDKSRADLDLTAASLARTYPGDYPTANFRAVEVPLKQELTSGFRTTLWLLLGTAAFVLLIVCASIANLLLARMVRREREMSVRAALGATRTRLLRQLLTESLILAVAGGALGLAIAALAMKLLTIFVGRFTPRAAEISIDHNVLLFTLGVSVLTGLIFGSIPAFSRRFDVAPSLRDGTRSVQSSQKIRSALIVAQVTASFMLLIAAGLMLRSLLNVEHLDPGFHTENLLTFRANMSFDKFPLNLPRVERMHRTTGYWHDLEARLRALPGITQVGGGGTFPLNENDPFPAGLQREFHPIPAGTQAPLISFRVASVDYFRALGQPLVAGRGFTEADNYDSPGVVVINQTAARHFWPNENPIGTRLLGGNKPFRTVVGVVADVRQQLDRAPADEVYVPMQQFALLDTTWIVHSRIPLDQTIAEIKDAAHAHDSDLPVAQFRTLSEVRATGLEPRRVLVALIGLFGVLALVITAAGIAGVIAFSVNQRTQEFGIRMALGAPRGRVLGLVIREGLLLVTIGLGLGLAGALALARVLRTVLFVSQPPNGLNLFIDVGPTDLATYLGVALTLAAVALLACAIPARRAASVDPIIALRAQ